MMQKFFPRRLAFRVALPFRALSVGVRAMVFDPEGRILLVRHTYMPGWDFPGGGVKKGETASSAIAREIAEETNIRLTKPPRLVGVHLNRYLDARDHVLFYHCDEWERIAPFSPSLEISEAAFHHVDALPEDLTRGARNRIDEWLNDRPASEDW